MDSSRAVESSGPRLDAIVRSLAVRANLAIQEGWADSRCRVVLAGSAGLEGLAATAAVRLKAAREDRVMIVAREA